MMDPGQVMDRLGPSQLNRLRDLTAQAAQVKGLIERPAAQPRGTRIWYDTEFVEDGRTIDLLSIAMVAEDGRELYRVLDEPDVIQRAIDRPWLRDNVVKYLPVTILDAHGNWEWDKADEDWANTWPRDKVRLDVDHFIRETVKPELWAWYASYDHVCYAQLFGRMIDLPDGFPMWTNDLKQEVHRLGDPQLPESNQAEHHAMADARELRERHIWLEEWERNQRRAIG